MPDLLSEISFFIQRLDWISLLDLALVTLIFFIILVVVRDTQAMVLLRGVIFLVVVFSLLTAIINLPAFSWLVSTVLPSLLLASPVLFSPVSDHLPPGTLAEWILRDRLPVRFQLQLHKLLWCDNRGR